MINQDVEPTSHYLVSEEEKSHFKKNGYVTLKKVLSIEELSVIEGYFDKFMRGEIDIKGKDFCDMSAGFDRNPEDFELVNAMLPRKYHPELQRNIFEMRAESIAKQLLGEDMTLDYDQFLGKKPKQKKAAFAMHQDMAYWPPQTPDTRTATVSLAINQASIMSGCLQVVPESQKEQVLRSHRNAISNEASNRNDSHAQTVDILDGESIEYCPLEAGDVTVHDEWIIHGSGGNRSDHWRKTYVIAFRSQETVKWERSHGFTHSHNDEVNWDNFDQLIGERI